MEYWSNGAMEAPSQYPNTPLPQFEDLPSHCFGKAGEDEVEDDSAGNGQVVRHRAAFSGCTGYPSDSTAAKRSPRVVICSSEKPNTAITAS